MMMLDATAKNAAPNGAREVAPDLAVLDGFEVLPEPEAPEPAAVVLAAVLDVADYRTCVEASNDEGKENEKLDVR
jgi:hypothetical protein